MKIGIVAVPYISHDEHFEQARATLASLSSAEHELDLIAVINGMRDNISDKAWLMESFHYAEINSKNCLALAWNRGLEIAFLRGADYALVINLDIVFQPSTIDSLVIFAQEEPEALLWSPIEYKNWVDFTAFVPEEKVENYAHYSCFLVNPLLLGLIGKFDEQFEPAYYEDSDISYRIKLARGRQLSTRRSAFFHAQTGTITGALHADFDLLISLKSSFETNPQRYVAKWGAMPYRETYHYPYDDFSRSAAAHPKAPLQQQQREYFERFSTLLSLAQEGYQAAQLGKSEEAAKSVATLERQAHDFKEILKGGEESQQQEFLEILSRLLSALAATGKTPDQYSLRQLLLALDGLVSQLHFSLESWLAQANIGFNNNKLISYLATRCSLSRLLYIAPGSLSPSKLSGIKQQKLLAAPKDEAACAELKDFLCAGEPPYDLIYVSGIFHAALLKHFLDLILPSLPSSAYILIPGCNPTFETRQLFPQQGSVFCGDIWRAIVHYRQLNYLDIAVADFELGTAVICKRENSLPLNNVIDYHKLSWKELQGHRAEWLRPMPMSQLCFWL